MTNINGTGDSYRTERTQRLDTSRRTRKAAPDPYTASMRRDSAEISAEARLLAAARDVPPVRMDKVDALREKLNDPNFDLDAAFKDAVRLMLKAELDM